MKGLVGMCFRSSLQPDRPFCNFVARNSIYEVLKLKKNVIGPHRRKEMFRDLLGWTKETALERAAF